jgi:outer membrane protein
MSMKSAWVLMGLGVLLVAAGVMRADAAGPAAQKIAYVDLQKTLNETAVGKKARKKLEDDKAKKQAELKKKETEVTTMAAELDKQRGVLKPDVLKQREMEVQKKYVALQELYMQLQQDLAKQEAALVREIFAKAGPVIEKIAKKDGYTLILEKNESAVLFAADGMDITAQVNAQVK